MADTSLSLVFKGTIYPNPAMGFSAVAAQLQETWNLEAKVVAGALREYLMHVAAILAEQHGTAWPGGTSEKSLSRRTGSLVNSIVRSVSVTGTTWATLKGSIGGRDYVSIHEFGGTITSQGKLMTIPLPAALSSRGTAPPFARQWKNTFVARTKAGNLIIFQKRGNDEIVPLYLLRKSITIKPRLGMRKELDDQIPYFLSRALDKVSSEFYATMGATT